MTPSSIAKQKKILVFTQFLIVVATSISLPFWPLIVKEQIGPNAASLHIWSTLIYSVPLIATIFAGPFWGTLADRFGYKRMVLRASLGLAIVLGLIITAKTPLSITIYVLLQGIFCGFTSAAQALGVKLVPYKEQSTMIANLQSATALGSVVGPILGGVIFNYFHYSVIFINAALICFFCALILQWTIKEPLSEEKKVKKIKLLLAIPLEKHCCLIFIAIFLAQTAFFMLTPIFALYVVESLAGNKIDVGILYAASGAMLFIFAPIWGRLQARIDTTKKSPYTFVIVALVICTLLHLWLANSDNFYVTLFIRLLWGVALGGLLPVLFAIIVNITEHSIKGRAVGYANSASKFGNLAGILLGSFCAGAFGVDVAIEMTAMVYLVNLIFILFAKARFSTALIKQEPDLH